MRMITILLITIFTSIIGCTDKNDSSMSSSIVGYWEVKSIIEDELVIQKELPNDSIMIEFQEEGTIKGNSLRNLLTGSYQLLDNDSIWVSTIGGTEVNETKWEKKFKVIMPMITFFDFKGENELVLYTSNRRSQIILNKK